MSNGDMLTMVEFLVIMAEALAPMVVVEVLVPMVEVVVEALVPMVVVVVEPLLVPMEIITIAGIMLHNKIQNLT